MPNNHPKKLIVVAGPTAVGKTITAIQLAQYFHTEIISADSRQFYKELKIGTAAPSAEELSAVPHHFIGHLSIHDYYNASRFENDVLKLLEQLFKTYDVVIMVGGSGLYIDAVCKGIDDLPDIPIQTRNHLKQQFQQKGIEYLQQTLEKYDPEYYQQVDLQNHSRLLRALEIIFVSGKTVSELRNQATRKRNFDIIEIGLCLDRPILIERIHHRIDQMLQNGLLDEVEEYYPMRHLNALNTVGYKEFFKWKEGKISFEQAVEDLKTDTRRYAKRQMTWFRRYEKMQWFSPMEIKKIETYCDNIINLNTFAK